MFRFHGPTTSSADPPAAIAPEAGEVGLEIGTRSHVPELKSEPKLAMRNVAVTPVAPGAPMSLRTVARKKFGLLYAIQVSPGAPAAIDVAPVAATTDSSAGLLAFVKRAPVPE